MKLLSIGSVIKYEDTKLMIVGHSTKKETNKYSYVVVPYPIGFAGKDKILTIEVDKEVQVLYEGYKNEQGDKYISQLGKMADLTPAQIVVANTIVTEALKYKKGGKQ